MIDQRRTEQTESRGGKWKAVSFEEFADSITKELSDAKGLPWPDPQMTAFDLAWAKTTLDLALENLKRYYDKRGKGDLFAELKNCKYLERLTGEERAGVAARLGFSSEKLSVERTRFQRRLRNAIREVISHTVASEGKSAETFEREIDEEMRYMAALLASEGGASPG